jgi:hypothetical protein
VVFGVSGVVLQSLNALNACAYRRGSKRNYQVLSDQVDAHTHRCMCVYGRMCVYVMCVYGRMCVYVP